MVKRKRGRPKGSKNKPKDVPKKRGRPRLHPIQTTAYPVYEGVTFVVRVKGPGSETHRWAASVGNQLIGYYKTPQAASEAYQNHK